MDFEVDRGWLTHFPSRYSFKFDGLGNVAIRTRCACAHLSVRVEEGQELWTAYREWHASYWRPIEINRQFATLFRSPNMLQRAIRGLLSKARRILLDPTLDEEPARATSDRAAVVNG
jgi:flavin-dependent dehydrogenase